MSKLCMSTAVVNAHSQILPYLQTSEQGNGLMDLLSYYQPRGGIRQVVTYFRSGGAMPLYVGHSEYYDFDSVVAGLTEIPGLSSQFRNSMFGGGKGSDIAGMFISATAETVERAVGALGYFLEEENLVYGSFRELTAGGLNCVGPDELCLFADEQFGKPGMLFDRFTEDIQLRWIRGNRLLSQAETWIPAQIVLPYYQRVHGESLIGYSTTGGLACHINAKEAILHGVMELIERDAVNLHWNCRRRPTLVELDTEPLHPSLHRLLSLSSSLPANFRFYLHETEFVEAPVVTVIGFSPSFNRYSYYAGGGVGFDLEEAMHYALSEYGQSEGTLKTLLVAPDWELAKSATRIFGIGEKVKTEEINHFFKIIAYYGYASNAEKLEWYLSENPVVKLSHSNRKPYRTTNDRYNRILEILTRHAVDPIVFDLTPSHMGQLKLIKVYSPTLTPPYVQSLPLLGNKRYYELPQQLGWSENLLTYSDLTVDPQPYP